MVLLKGPNESRCLILYNLEELGIIFWLYKAYSNPTKQLSTNLTITHFRQVLANNDDLFRVS